MRADQPDYWRIAALDQYSSEDGGQWTLSAEGDDSVRGRSPERGSRRRPVARSSPSARSASVGCPPRSVPSPSISPTRSWCSRPTRSSPTHPTSAGSTTPSRRSCRRSQARSSPRSRSRRRPRRRRRTSRRSRRAAGHRRDRPDRADHATGRRRRRRDHPVRAGGGAPRPLPQSPTFVYDTGVDIRDSASAILEFLGEQARVLRAVRQRVRGDGAQPRHPTRVGGRLHPRRSSPTAATTCTSHDAHAWPEIWLDRHRLEPSVRPDPRRNRAKPPAAATSPTTPPPTPPRATAPTVTTTPAVTSPPPAGGTGSPQTPGTAPATPTPTLAPATASSSGDALGPWRVVIVVLVGWRSSSARTSLAVLIANGGDADRRHAVLLIPRSWWPVRGRKPSTELREADLATDPALTANELAGVVPDAPRPADPAAAPRPRAASTARHATATVPPEPTTRATRGHRSASSRARWTTVCRWTRRWRRRLDLSVFTRR